MSRSISSISELEESNKPKNLTFSNWLQNNKEEISKIKRINKVFAKPPWIDENLEFHNKFWTDLPRDDLFGSMKVPKSRKKRVVSKAVDEDQFRSQHSI